MDAKTNPDDRPGWRHGDDGSRTDRLWAAILEAASEGMVVTDDRGNIVLVNRAYSRITGYSPDEVIGINPRVLQSGRHDKAFYEAMWQTLNTEGNWKGEIWNRRKDGEIYPSWVSISAVRDATGEISHYLGIFSDISIVKAAQQQLAYLAHHDPLTELPNRLMLIERLEHAMELAQRMQSAFALLFIDLDNFKLINDGWGHEAGDQVLITVAGCIRQVVRAADTVARLGGDEFVVLLENIGQESAAAQVAKKILLSINAARTPGGYDKCLSASVGITLYPRDAGDVTTLMHNADLAMYRSKNAGRNRATIYRESFSEPSRRRAEIERKLCAARDRG